MISEIAFKELLRNLDAHKAQLVAVSKTKTAEEISVLYGYGQRIFGENYVQELREKARLLPNDVQWHFIGHLQKNKVKYIAPFVALIHSVDSEDLLHEIEKQARKANRIVSVLLEVFIASEDTKHGWEQQDLIRFMESFSQEAFPHVCIRGLMGMASFTHDESLVSKEFSQLNTIFNQLKTMGKLNEFDTLSMGMSSDYEIAINQGSNMVRIGSMLFGSRN